MIEIKCRNCGNTDLKFEDGFYVCPFCGSRYLPEIGEIPDSLNRNNEVLDDNESDDFDEDYDLEEWEDLSEHEEAHDKDDPKNTGDFNKYDGIKETTDSTDVETEETENSTDNVTDSINGSTEEIVFSFEKNKKTTAAGKTTTAGYQSKSKKEEDNATSRAVTFVAVILVAAFGVYYLLKASFEVSQETGGSFVAVGAIIFCIFVVIGVIVYIKHTISDRKKKKK